MTRRGWTLAAKRGATDRVLAGELPSLVARDLGVRRETLLRWLADRAAAQAELAEMDREVVSLQAKARMVATLAEKGRALLELDAIAFVGLIEWADAAIACCEARRKLAPEIARRLDAACGRAPTGEVN